jgi:hypothetical protein
MGPGPHGPGRPRRSASRASWARADLFWSSGRSGLRTHRARTSSPDRQQDFPSLGSPRHVADSSGGERCPLGCCAAAGAVTWRSSGPASDAHYYPAALDPGPAGPVRPRRSATRAPWAGPVSTVLADVAGSGRTGPGPVFRICRRTVPVLARRATLPTHWAERADPLGC